MMAMLNIQRSQKLKDLGWTLLLQVGDGAWSGGRTGGSFGVGRVVLSLTVFSPHTSSLSSHGQIHDEVIVEGPDESKEEALAEVCMTHVKEKAPDPSMPSLAFYHNLIHTTRRNASHIPQPTIRCAAAWSTPRTTMGWGSSWSSWRWTPRSPSPGTRPSKGVVVVVVDGGFGIK